MEYPFKDLMPLDEVLAREGYYKDWTHLDPEVFYSLTQISNFIKTKGYGVDVRLLIAQLAEHFGLKTKQVVDLANLLQDKFDNLEGVTSDFTNDINGLVAQMQAEKDAVIANVTVDSEVILARGAKPTLGARLDETTAQLAQTREAIPHHQSEAVGNGANQKIIHRNSENEFSVISRRISGKGFTRMIFSRGSGINADSANYGGDYGLLRLTNVHSGEWAIAFHQPKTFTTSKLHTAGIDDFYVRQYGHTNSVPSQVDYISNNLRQMLGSWLEFEAEITDGNEGVLKLGFYPSSITCEKLNVYINGTKMATVNSAGTGDVVERSVPIGNYFGKVTVRLEVDPAATGKVVHFLGYNVHHINNVRNGMNYNGGIFKVTVGKHYISQSVGANEYALREYGGKWMGSFHGGETSIGLKLLLDNVDISEMPVGTSKIGKKFQIIQQTNMIDKITTNSITTVNSDGVYDFNCRFEVLTPFEVSDFYITMTCANDNYNTFLHPKYFKRTTDGDISFPNTGKAVQYDDVTNQQITTLFNIEREYFGTQNTYLRQQTGTYAKFYHGKVVAGKMLLEPINFSNIKIFD